MSVSFDRVMDVRRSFAQAVSKQWAEDGVVVPNSAKWKVFVTSTADNLDEPRCFEYHGTAITLISHVSHDTDSVRENHPPLSLDVTEKNAIQLPGDCAVVQKYAMLISKKAADFINSGQVPVIVGDCPLYAQQKNSVSGSFPMRSVNQRWCIS